MKEIRLTIPHFGYRIEMRERTIDCDTAPDVLTAAKQRKITCAVRNGNDVVITKHVIVCSSCGKETPAYAEFIGYNEKSLKSRTRNEIEQWVTRQLSLFEDTPQEIYFNTPIGGMSHFTCPHCGTVLVSGKYKFQVVIRPCLKNKSCTKREIVRQ